MQRRKFLKIGVSGIAVLSLGQLFGCSERSNSSSAVPEGERGEVDVIVRLSIEEALFEMVDGTLVYHWAFQDRSPAGSGLPQLPGPVITAVSGQKVLVSISNNLDEEHAFSILGVPETAVTVPAGGNRSIVFTAPAAGTYLYLDHLNEPVNRVLGLHGAMVVLPREGNTPYSDPTIMVQKLFDDLGTKEHFPQHLLSPPGWQPERWRLWLFHQVDPAFNARALSGETIMPADLTANFLPRYFNINGKSGVFAAHNPETTLKGRIGQPMLVRLLNAGLFTHSPHLHANHFYVTAVNGLVQDNVFFVDTFRLAPLDTIDWLVPFIRPPDIPGDPAQPLRELIPNELALSFEGPNGSPGVAQSPLLYPMHCHNETSQTAAGGNYPQGAVLHMEFLGDLDGVDFPGADMHGGNSPAA